MYGQWNTSNVQSTPTVAFSAALLNTSSELFNQAQNANDAAYHKRGKTFNLKKSQKRNKIKYHTFTLALSTHP